MSDISLSSTAVNTPESNQQPKQVPRSRRRDKPQLSCTLCRRRKLKCDRKQPCETCSNRGLSLSCTYIQSSTQGDRVEQSRSPQSPSSSIHGRIEQLEGLVLSLMSTLNAKKASSATAQPLKDVAAEITNTAEIRLDLDEQSQLSDSFGRIKLENAETSYVSGAHWEAILDGIAELKDHVQDTPSPFDEQSTEAGEPETEEPELLLGRNKYATKQEILAAIPSRYIVDRLISRYFNAMDMATVIIHSPTFLEEYEKFWENPSATPVMWLGLLFTMMCLGTQFQQFVGDEPGEVHRTPYDTRHLVQKYREKIVQCLILGNYTKCTLYTIETLLLYFTIEHFGCPDTQMGTWLLLGIIIHIAMRMGYHRDASHSPRISPFHAEMRRRAWATIVQLDLAISSQIGLPRMVNERQSDTAEPRNLLDDDFDANMIELPPPRPDTDLTPVLYTIARGRLGAVFGMISDLTTSARPSSYSEVMKLDGMLNEARSAIPPGLKVRAMARSITDHPDIIMRRIHLALIFHQAQCVLHRKYSNSKYTYSRQVCSDAALEILQHQYTLDQEMQVGGQLHQVRWKVSSLLNHDFLLATTILCLNLDRELTAEAMTGEVIVEATRREKVIHALQESYGIWQRASNTSREAQKAADVLRLVLGKIRAMNMSNRNNGRAQLMGVNDNSFGLSPDISRYHGHITTSMDDRSSQSLLSNASGSPLSTFGDTMGSSRMNDEFDWEKWDSQFRGQLFGQPADIENALDTSSDLFQM